MRTHLRRVALAIAAIFFLLTISAGALHHHGSSPSAHRIDCQACAWVHLASGALSHAAPVLVVTVVSSAHPAPGVSTLVSIHASPHHGRAPPFSLV
jgi:uncharacterized membrane protein YgdD (TMEM256/DUF423 family)